MLALASFIPIILFAQEDMPDAVSAIIPPSLITQPASRVVIEGDSVSFSVTAMGSTPFSFQWKKNKTIVPGATDATISLGAVAKADSGSKYRCIVSNAAGTVLSSEALLHVTSGMPTLVVQPQSITVVEGSPATFSVGVRGAPPLTYRWQKNRTNISGATASSYTIPNVLLSDHRSSFRCIISNAVGTATSDAAILTVGVGSPTIVSQPHDQQVALNHRGTFIVKAAGQTPISYQWMKNGLPITGLQEYYHRTLPTHLSDSGSVFRCVVSNAYGSVTTNPAQLRVLPSTPISDDFSAAQLDTSIWHAIDPKGDVTFRNAGISTSSALLAIDIPGGVSHDLWTTNNAPRVLQAVSDTDFEIEVKMQSMFDVHYQSQGIVVEHDSANLLRFDVIQTMSGLRLFCGKFVDGVPSIVLDEVSALSGPIFLRVCRQENNWTFFYSGDGTAWTQALSFAHPLMVRAVGMFAANHGVPESTTPPFAALFDFFFNTATPIVPEDPHLPPTPPGIIKPPANATVIDGQPYGFYIIAAGSDPLAYQWQKNGSEIIGATDSAYSDVASIADSGTTFRCVVTNPFGIATSIAATLGVLGIPPAIVQHPSNTTVLLGSPGRFSVNATGSDTLRYQWQKDTVDIKGATRTTYITPPTTMADSGSGYRCVVSNAYGTVTSNAAVLFVQATLSGLMRFVNVIVDEANPRHTHCKALGDIDGDGFVDVLAASGRNAMDGLFWYKYPAWSKYRIHEGSFSTFMQVADIDGDGDLDAVIPKGEDIGESVWWYENPRPLGNPSKDPWIEHLIGAGWAHDLEVADMDGDGRIDVVGRYSDASMFLQVAPDVWQKVLLQGRWAEGSALADLDGDSDLDLLNGGWWLRNPLPDGNIADPLEWQTIIFDDNWEAQIGVGAADLNGDGRTDALLAPSHNMKQMGLYWYEQPESVSGEWVKHAVDTTVNNIHNVETADMNNDGHVDIVIGEMYFSDDPDEVNVYLGNGTGSTWTKNTIDIHGAHSVYVGDIGNDGDLDIMSANGDEEAPDASPVEIWENLLIQPKLTLDSWARHVVDSTREWQSLFLYHSDLDNDGKVDIVTGGWWYKNPGKVVEPWVKENIGEPLYNVGAVFDFDLDGNFDVIGSQGHGPEPSSTLVWGKNDGDGHFTILENIQPAQGDFLQGVAVHRFTLDGPVEVALSWEDKAAGVQMLTVPVDASNQLWTWRKISETSQGEQLTAKDIDIDRSIDLLLGTKWLRNEIEAFTPHDIAPAGPQEPDRSRLADINNDGLLDAIVGTEAIDTPGKLAWYEHPLSAIEPWKEHIVSTTVIGPMSVDVADMDHDGDKDIIVGEHFPSSPDSARLIIFENTDFIGQTWVEHLVYMGDEHHDGAQVVDIDGDGDLDIISIGWANSDVLLYENLAVNASGTVRSTAMKIGKTGSAALPREFALYQNFPNPFNPTTTIHYDVAEGSHVSLKLFNLLGQEVGTLVDQMQKAGQYSLNLNASSLASGVYLYRMQAGNFVSTKKLMIVK